MPAFDDDEALCPEPLPGILGEIEAVAGRAAAIEIARVRGGTEVYLPSERRLKEDHWLAQAVGFDAARSIVRELMPWGGSVIVPLAMGHVLELRQALVRDLVNDGQSVAEIARRLGMTSRGIERIKARLRAAGEIE